MTLPPERVEALLRAACLAELDALKPGNVHRHADGHGMTVADFETSAAVTAAALSRPHASVGAMIHDAVARTHAAVGCNTNLGIVLLCAPLARAALQGEGRDLRRRLAATLDALDLEDSRRAYAAIALAAPAGLGESDREDVHGSPTLDLKAAMALAQDRDRVARQYATAFADIFEYGIPTIRAALARGWDQSWTLTRVYLGFLAAFPDSHVQRKHGSAVAEGLCREAEAWSVRIARTDRPGVLTEDLLVFDRALKGRGINPGTSADLTVASCLAHHLDRALAD